MYYRKMKKFLLFLSAEICVGMVQARPVIVPRVIPARPVHVPHTPHNPPSTFKHAGQHAKPASVKPVQITPRYAKAYRPLCYTPMTYPSPYVAHTTPLMMFWWYPCFVPHSYPYRAKPTGTNTVQECEK